MNALRTLPAVEAQCIPVAIRAGGRWRAWEGAAFKLSRRKRDPGRRKLEAARLVAAPGAPARDETPVTFALPARAWRARFGPAARARLERIAAPRIDEDSDEARVLLGPLPNESIPADVVRLLAARAGVQLALLGAQGPAAAPARPPTAVCPCCRRAVPRAALFGPEGDGAAPQP